MELTELEKLRLDIGQVDDMILFAVIGFMIGNILFFYVAPRLFSLDKNTRGYLTALAGLFGLFCPVIAYSGYVSSSTGVTLFIIGIFVHMVVLSYLSYKPEQTK